MMPLTQYVSGETLISSPPHIHAALQSLAATSAAEQRLRAPLSPLSTLLTPETIVALHDGAPVGYARMATRKLYLYPRDAPPYPVSAPVLMDFVVALNVRRGGIGRGLLKHLCDHHRVSLEDIGVDKPSPACRLLLKQPWGRVEDLPCNIAISPIFLQKNLK